MTPSSPYIKNKKERWFTTNLIRASVLSNVVFSGLYSMVRYRVWLGLFYMLQYPYRDDPWLPCSECSRSYVSIGR